MEYRIKLTNYAVAQIQEITSYIARVLQAPDTARRWLVKLKQDISSLNTMPSRYPLTPEEPWRSEGVHKMLVSNFLVYYWIYEVQKVVWVTAVVYGRRDQIQVLRDIPKDKI